MTALPYHPLANIFPLIEGKDFEIFCAGLKLADRLHEKIVLLDGQILDGRNRQRGCDAVGVTAHYRVFDPKIEGSPQSFVIAKNLTRRHLNDDQRRMVAAKLVNLGQGRPEQNPQNAGIKVADAAKLINVDEPGTERARTVLARAEPEIQKAVETGKLSVNAAAQASRLEPEAQREIATQAATGKANIVRNVIKKGVRKVREKELGDKIRALPDEKFGFILADPEWNFTPYSEETGSDRSASNHYPTSPDAVIEQRGVPDIAAPDSVCGLWVTDLARGIDTLRAWGFTFKSYFVWVKDIVDLPLTDIERGALDASDNSGRTITVGNRRVLIVSGAQGTGYWNTDRDELFLIGTKGHPICPAQGEQGESVWFAPRGEHSKSKGDAHSDKPEISYLWIERHFANTPKIELNARRARPGWKVWGNEAPDTPIISSTTREDEEVIAEPATPNRENALTPAPAEALPENPSINCIDPEPIDPNDPDNTGIPTFCRRSVDSVPVVSRVESQLDQRGGGG